MASQLNECIGLLSPIEKVADYFRECDFTGLIQHREASMLLFVEVCWGELREHDEKVIAIDEMQPFGRHREFAETQSA